MTQDEILSLATADQKRRAADDRYGAARLGRFYDAGVINLDAVAKSHNLGPVARAVVQRSEIQATPENFLSVYNSAPRGARVILTGNLTLTSQLILRDGVVISPGANGAQITFQRPTTDSNGWAAKNAFAVIQASGTTDNGFEGYEDNLLKLRFNVGGAWLEGGASNFVRRYCDVIWGMQGNYYNRLSIFAGSGCAGINNSYNWLHHSPKCDRAHELWGPTNGNIVGNRYYDVNDGGHINGLYSNLNFTDNLGQLIHRMGQEIQDEGVSFGAGGNNINVARNCFYNWSNPWVDSFGISLMPQHANNVICEDNYMGVFAPGSNQPTGGYGTGGRAGYGIEYGVLTGECRRNKITGDWVAGVSYSMPNSVIHDNQFNGHFQWNKLMSEAGNGNPGHGVLAASSVSNNDVSPRPDPPIIINSDGSTGDAQGSAMVISNVKAEAFAVSSQVGNRVKVTWVVTGATDADVVSIVRLQRDGTTRIGGVVTKPAKDGQWIDDQLDPNWISSTWHIIYSVAGSKAQDVQVGLPIVVPGNDFHVDEVTTHSFDVVSGIVQGESTSTKTTVTKK